MTHKNIKIDGTPIPQGHCVTPDHSVQTFVVQIRSLSGIHPDTVKDQLQKKWEVINIEKTDQTNYVR